MAREGTPLRTVSKRWSKRSRQGKLFGLGARRGKTRGMFSRVCVDSWKVLKFLLSLVHPALPNILNATVFAFPDASNLATHPIGPMLASHTRIFELFWMLLIDYRPESNRPLLNRCFCQTPVDPMQKGAIEGGAGQLNWQRSV